MSEISTPKSDLCLGSNNAEEHKERARHPFLTLSLSVGLQYAEADIIQDRKKKRCMNQCYKRRSLLVLCVRASLLLTFFFFALLAHTEGQMASLRGGTVN